MSDNQQTVEEALGLLKSLQGIFDELRTLQELLDAKPKELEAAKARVERQREASAAVDEDEKKLQLQLKECETDLQAGEEKIKKLKEQQNSIKDNRAYRALTDEIANIKVEMERTEDKMLEIMTQLEEMAERRRAVERNVEEEEQRLQQAAQSIQAEIDELQAEYDELKAEADRIAAQVDPRYLEPFQRLSKIRGGVALAPVKGSICGGCFINLTAQTINALMNAHELVHCHSCGRILYLEES